MAETINAGHAKHRALVDAGVLPDDGPELVRRVTFEAPVVDRGLHSDRLVLVVYGPEA